MIHTFTAQHSFLARAIVSFSFLLIASTTFGETILLSELIESNGTVTSGDKEFSEFTYAATGDMPTSDRVNVVTFEDSLGNFGLRFQGGFLDLPGDGGSDALITYTVNVTDPSQQISKAHIGANVISPNDGSGTITETFFPTFTGEDEFLRIPTEDGQWVDWIEFDGPVSSLQIQKNILFAAGPSGQVDMSFVDQTFEQVPEPGTFALAILALCGLFGAARRVR